MKSRKFKRLNAPQPGLPMKKGRMGYDDPATTSGTGQHQMVACAQRARRHRPRPRNMARHRHQEFIRFLNALEREDPAGQDGSRDRRQLRRAQDPAGAALAGPAPALDLPLHADVHPLAETRSRASSPSSSSGASSVACSAHSSTSRPPSTASWPSTIKTPSRSSGAPIPTRSSPPAPEGSKR